MRIPPRGRAQVREATARDLRATARLHEAGLSGLFVTFGTRFLRTYHATFYDAPSAVSLVAVRDGAVVGFLCGTLDNDEHARHLVRRHGVRLAAAGVAALARRPRVAWVVARTRSRRYLRAVVRRLPGLPRRGPTPAHAGGAMPRPASVAVLTHVAVADAARGSGAGRLLVDAFVARARTAGATEIRLVTDPTTAAPAFYRHLGWTSLGERAGRGGSQVEEFRLPL